MHLIKGRDKPKFWPVELLIFLSISLNLFVYRLIQDKVDTCVAQRSIFRIALIFKLLLNM